MKSTICNLAGEWFLFSWRKVADALSEHPMNSNLPGSARTINKAIRTVRRDVGSSSRGAEATDHEAGAGPKGAAIFPIVESCRRLGLPTRQPLHPKPGSTDPRQHTPLTRQSNLPANPRPRQQCTWPDEYGQAASRVALCSYSLIAFVLR
jgi:hypothetical protein